MLRIDERARQETVELLKTLVGTRSANPPGNEDEIAAVVEGFLAENGIDAIRVPLEEGRSSIVARIPGRDPGSIVLCAHLDTVNADEEKWTVPPYEGQIVGERITGLGTADMKGGLAVILEIAKLIAHGGFPLRKSLVLALTADEEGAYRGAASVAKSGLIDDAQFLIIAEPTAEAAYIGNKGELWVEAIFSGRAAHGATPQLGVNSILPAAMFCLELAQAIEGFKEQEGRGRVSLNIGQLNGGRQINIVPDTTQVRLDFRTVVEQEKEQILSLVEELGTGAAAQSGARFSVKIATYKPPIASDVNNPHVRDFLAVAAGDTRPILSAEIVPYCTDAVAIVPTLAIPVVIYGPGSIAQAHQPDEFLELASLYEALEVLSRFLNTAVMSA